jgi:hypothetical protein
MGLLYLRVRDHSSLLFINLFCVFAFTRFGLTYSPSSTTYVYNVTNGDFLLECRLSMDRDGAELVPLHPGS